MALDTQQQILIEQRITNESKNIVVAYLLLIFLGIFGAHRFYLGRTTSGIFMLILTITFFGLIISGIWAFVDLFLVPGMVNEDRDKLRQRLTMEAMVNSGGTNQTQSPSAQPAPAAPVQPAPAPESPPQSSGDSETSKP